MARWTCPFCDREFGRTGQSHVCEPVMTVDAYYAAQPAFHREIYDAVAAHLADLGDEDVVIEAAKVGILIKRKRTFVELRPKKKWLALSIMLSRRIESERISRVVRAGPARVANFVNLRGADEVDEEILEWIAESYEEFGD